MRVTILGSGTAVPNADRFPAGYLVADGGTRVLVDLGPGVLRRAAACGIDLGDIDAVLLTHFHTDHCADLAALLFGLRSPRYEGRRPLLVAGAHGLAELLGHLTAAWPWLSPRGFELEVREIGEGGHEIAGLRVEAVRVEHTDASLGYRVTGSNGAVAAFSGDAVYCPALVPLARGAELFICDSAFPGALPGPGHMTPAEAGRAAAAAGVHTLVPTHFYPECDGHDLEAEARAEFTGEVVLARDLLSFELAPGRVGHAES
ncbi:MAG: ribonuclease Z [Planctomycetota bacterium]|nr:ribonuclease Z [Planctomycetota bacterium]MDA0931991.1 ribonuclease Z [Planctomycetota bacterium]